MTRRGREAGVALGLMSVLFWGSQFTVGKSLFGDLDPYSVTLIRYATMAIVFVGLVAVVEGRGSLRYGSFLPRAIALGLFGFVGSVLVGWIGLDHTRTQDASLVVSMQALLTAIVLRVRGGLPLRASTRVAIVVAFVGAALVISRGDPAAFVDGNVGWGVFLCLFAQLSWVVYTIESTSFPGWSSLRFTALTTLPGAIGVLVVTLAVAPFGLVHATPAGVGRQALPLAFMVIGPTLLAVFAWNLARVRLGAQDVSLFMNLVPVTTFTIESIRGYRPGWVELLGAVLTIGALVGDNVAQRRAAAALRRLEPAPAD